MSTIEQNGTWTNPTTSGIVAILIGVGLTLFYPLSMAGILPGTGRMAQGVPSQSHPFTVYFSVILGSVLVTWGLFAYRDDEYEPLTPQRALLAFLPAIFSASLGVGWFVYTWTTRTVTDLEGQPVEYTTIQILRLELTAVQFVAFAGVSSAVVGAVAATSGRRTGIKVTAVPLVLIAVGFLWSSFAVTPFAVVSIVVATTVPFAIGYAATRSKAGERPR